MLICLLCQQGLQTPNASAVAAAAAYIEIYSEEGIRQDVGNIVSRHLWLKPKHDAYPAECICLCCWRSLQEFHIFYERIAKAHNYYVGKLEEELKSVAAIAAATSEEPRNDPFLNDVTEVNLQMNELCESKLLEDLTVGCFDSDVKVEALEFEPLPQIQVLEDMPVTALSERPQRACRRRTQLSKDKSFKGETAKNAAEYDSEPELPLAVLMKVDYKTDIKLDATAAETFAQIAGETSTQDVENAQLKRRRGRPRKVKEQQKMEIVTETTTAEDELCKHNSQNELSDDDMHDATQADVTYSGTDDSSSSSSDSENAADTDDTWNNGSKPTEQYAVIPKRVVVKPKKYRKREKPIVPPKRLPREEIERRIAQQAEYDEIITSFVEKYVCPKCNLLVKNFGDMKRHFRASHGDEPGYMICCGRKFVLRRALADHVLMHRNPEHFKCTICTRLFHDSRTLELHELAHNNPVEVKEKKKLFQCDKCPKSFTTKASFEYHTYSKHVPKSEFKYCCNVCNKKMPTERKLKDHMKYTHDPESAIMCDKCGKTLRSQGNLKRHHLIEHSDKPRPAPVPMQCEICGTWLRHLAGLKQHMRTIHEDTGGEHRCHICNKTSTNARALKRHIYHNHECERKFKCTMCEKAFKRPQDLREHTSTHTGEVLYTCPNCPMTFFSNANMYKHRQRLHRAEWEADRKKPHINIMQQAVGATVAMKLKQSIGATSAFFSHQQLSDAADVKCEVDFS